VILSSHLGALPGDMVDILQDARGRYLRLLLSDLRVLRQVLEKGHSSARPSVKALVDAIIELPGLGSTVTDDESMRRFVSLTGQLS
jgi:hypothetical protein